MTTTPLPTSSLPGSEPPPESTLPDPGPATPSPDSGPASPSTDPQPGLPPETTAAPSGSQPPATYEGSVDPQRVPAPLRPIDDGPKTDCGRPADCYESPSEAAGSVTTTAVFTAITSVLPGTVMLGNAVGGGAGTVDFGLDALLTDDGFGSDY